MSTEAPPAAPAASTPAPAAPSGDSMFAATPAPSAPPAAPSATPPAAPPAAPAPTAAPAWFAKLFTQDGKIDKTAYESAPDNVKKFRTALEQYETPEALFHALGHTKSLVGAKALSRLPADAPQEAKDAQAKVLREVLGVPDKPEGYGLKKPDQLPEGVQWDDAVVGKYAAVMHKHNLPPEAVQELVKLNMEIEGERAKGYGVEQEKQLQAEFVALDKSLPAGTTREQYLGEAAKGLALASKLTGIAEEELKASARTAKDVKLFAAFAQIAGEDKLVAAASDTGGVNLDAKITELMNSKEYMHSDEAVRGPVMAEVRRLLTLQSKLKK